MKKSIRGGIALLVLAGAASAHTIHIQNLLGPNGFTWSKNDYDVLTVKFCPKNIFKQCHEHVVLQPKADKKIGTFLNISSGINIYGYETVSADLNVNDNSTDIMVIYRVGRYKLWTNDPRCLRARNFVFVQNNDMGQKSTCDGHRVKWHYRGLPSGSTTGS